MTTTTPHRPGTLSPLSYQVFSQASNTAVYYQETVSVKALRQWLKTTVPAATGPFSLQLYVFSDQLLIDDQVPEAGSLVMVCRSVSVSASAPRWDLSHNLSSGGMRVLQLLTSAVSGSDWRLADSQGNDWVPLSVSQPGSGVRLVTRVVGSVEDQLISHDPMEQCEVLGHPLLVAYLQGELIQALTRMDSDDNEVRAEAAEMLDWITYLTTTRQLDPGLKQAAVLTLDQQARSLRLLCPKEGQGRSVPGLSLPFYLKRVKQLIAILQGYEGDLRQLTLRQDIAQAVGDLGSGLQAAADRELDHLRDTVSDLERAEKALVDQGEQLQFDFELRSAAVRRVAIRFQLGVQMKKFNDFCMAVLALVEAAVSIGAALGPALKSGSQVAAKGSQAILDAKKQQAMDAFNAEAADFMDAVDDNEPLLRVPRAMPKDFKLSAKDVVKLASPVTETVFKKLIEQNGALEKLAKGAKQLMVSGGKAVKAPQSQTLKGSLAADLLADLLKTEQADLEWDAFDRQVRLEVQPCIDSGVDGAAAYTLAVSGMVDYAKAMSANTIALVRKRIELHDARQRVEAAASTGQQWQTLVQSSGEAEEQRLLLQAELERRSADIKRALLVSVQMYRAAYYYRNLTWPTVHIRYDMDSTAIQKALVDLDDGTGNLLQNRHAEQDFSVTVELPIQWLAPLDFKALAQGAALPPMLDGPLPVLATQLDDRLQLSWQFSVWHPPFRNALPAGRLALFLKEAFFELEELDGLDEHVRLSVGYSGLLSNPAPGDSGGTPERFNFPARELDYVYERDNPEKGPSTHWKPADTVEDAYAQPSPFTQWSATLAGTATAGAAPRLKITLQGTYLKLGA